MKKEFLLLIITLFLGLSAAKAETDSGVLFFPSVTYTQQTGTITGDQSVLNLNLRGGYKISPGWYFGLIFLSTTGGGTSSINGSAIGNSIGFFEGYLSIIASYYLTAQITENTSTNFLARSAGQGFQMDLAFTMPLGGDFSLGPMVTYQNMSYSKRQDSTGALTSTNQTQQYIYPSISLIFRF